MLTALGVVVAGAVGAGCAALALTDTTPPTLSGARPIGSIPIEMQPFLDERSVDVTVSPGPETSLLVQAVGRVTRLDCQPTSTLTSGSSNLAVDGSPILNLATSVPLWRDLRPGDEGTDVLALQQELVRLGFDVAADGELGRGSIAAVDELLDRAGASLTEASDGVTATNIMWLPATEAPVSQCALSIGAVTSGQDAFATVATPPAEVAVLTPLQGAPIGARKLVIEGAEAPVDDTGSVVDPASRALFAATASYRGAQPDDSGRVQLAGILQLVEPVMVAAVPADAIYDIEATSGCVAADGAPHAITIVGSQLGQTYVIFDSEPPPTVDAAPDPGAAACR